MGDQLNLGGDVPEVVDFDEHVVNVPMPLILDEEVPGDALATYTVMKSFGKRAEASLAAYAERLKWSVDTVKKWQGVLVKTGWIVLLREGKDSRPRLWWMCKSKHQQPPLGVYISAPPEKLDPLKKLTPKQGLSRDRKVTNKILPPGPETAPGGQEGKPKGRKVSEAEPYRTSDGRTFQALVEAYEKAYRAFRLTQQPKPEDETIKADLARHIKKGARALSAHGKEKLFRFDEFERRLANLPRHPFAVRQDCSLTFFLSHNSEFADGAKALAGGPGQRYFSAPAEKRTAGED